MELGDKAQAGGGARDSVPLSDSASVQSNVFHSVIASDQLGLQETLRPDNNARDSLPLSDSASAQSAFFRPVTATDTVSIGDAASLPRAARDALPLADAASLPSRLVYSAVELADVAASVPGRGFLLAESLAVNAQLAVSVYWEKLFDELLSMWDCTPFVCNPVLHFNEGFTLEDLFSPPPVLLEDVPASDAITATAALQRGMGDALAPADRMSVTVRPAPPAPPPGSPAPPLGAMIVSDRAAVAPVPGTPVGGNYSLSGASDPAAHLLSALGLPATTVTGSVSRPDLAATMTVVLPTYHVNLVPSERIPGDDAMLTVRVAEIPAETPVTVPIDVAGTPQAAEHGEIPWVKLEYTPKVNSTDFALMITMIDSPPNGASRPAANFAPMYVDIRWTGSFSPAGLHPGTGDHYRSPPAFTFAVTEAWAAQQNVQRDENGVPVMSVSMLDEATGGWQAVTSIDRPTGPTAGGQQYVYVAHLAHFSTYVVTADIAVRGSGGVIPPPPAPAAASVSVDLADALAVTEQQRGTAVEVVEEFGGAKTTVRLAEQLGIFAKPVGIKRIQVGENVEIAISAQDVRQESILPPRVVATVMLEMVNRGPVHEEFVLELSYYDAHGKKAYQSFEVVGLGPHESRQVAVGVPFTSSGEFEVLVEVRSATTSNLLNSTGIQVSVPWLAINLYLVLAAAGAVLAAVIAALAYLYRRFRRRQQQQAA